MKLLLCLLIFFSFCIKEVNSQVVVKIEDAYKHIGDSVKIYTRIYGGRHLYRIMDSPTYLDVGADYPNYPLSIVIWG
jgi:hypothetical protein